METEETVEALQFVEAVEIVLTDNPKKKSIAHSLSFDKARGT